MIPCCATMSEQMPQCLSNHKVNDRHVQSCNAYAGFGPITAGTAYGGRHLRMYAAPRPGPAALFMHVSIVWVLQRVQSCSKGLSFYKYRI